MLSFIMSESLTKIFFYFSLCSSLGSTKLNGDCHIKSGVVEGSSMFRGNAKFQVKFDDDEGDGWFELDSFVSPNEFRNY